MRERVLEYIRRLELIRAGDRVGVAVSGGADSVALLRLMLELREELGVVLTVVHFNHKIRGADADADQQFVAELAAAHGLEFRCESADTPAYGREHRVSLEAAGRELRYGFFRESFTQYPHLPKAVTSGAPLNSIATAHTMDDQAETVLLRMIRGAGTRGMAGVFPKLSISRQPSAVSRQGRGSGGHEADKGSISGAIVRPLLQIRRQDLREYLKSLGQPWREDASNLDVKHTRNRLRHELLPIIEREFNPSVVQVLSEMAEVARAEEEHWEAEITKLLPAAHESRLDTQALRRLPLALQRRLVRAFAERNGVRLDFQHVEDVLEIASGVHPLESKQVELPEGRRLTCTARELAFDPRSQRTGKGYEYRLPVPGEVRIQELGRRLQVTVVRRGQCSSGYNQSQLLDLRRLAPELVVRNWRPGDRFWPAHTKSPTKLKELLLRRRIPRAERALWPVVVSGDELVWVPGLGATTEFLAGADTELAAVILEAIADR